ncbi:MAG: DUF3108 domain-containing protein [Desulfobaccales bacterium]
MKKLIFRGLGTMQRGPGAKPPWGRGFWRLLVLAAVAALALQAWPGAAAPAAVVQGQLLEDLNFRVEFLLWKDVAQARLTLTSLGPGRYRVELSGEPQGLMKAFTGQRRDSYQTEMIWRGGKLVPLVYREESRKNHKRYLKEYRFNYEKGELELWQWKEDRGVMMLKWHTALNGPIQDPLSAFYNYRLGLLGPIKEGETLRLEGIPYPKPEEIDVRIGPKTEWGRKVMVSINNHAFVNDRGTVFAYLDASRVPTKAWTDVLKMGTISGELLPGGKPLNGALPEMARTASPAAGLAD